MKKMYRTTLLFLLAAAALAQPMPPPDTLGPKKVAPPQPAAPVFEKAPAEVDDALRSRVFKLFTLFKARDYRPAEAYIAEDTKDYYYAGNKPEINSFELLTIEYFDNFTRAKAMSKVTEPVTVSGFPPGEISVTMPTLWKIEEGKWVLYEDKEKMGSPGGIQKKVQAALEAGTAAALGVSAPSPSTTGMLNEIPKDATFAMKRVQADKTEIEVVPDGTEQVTISNGSTGAMKLELGYHLNDIETKLDRTELLSGEKSVLTFKAGKQPMNGIFYLRIMPTDEYIAIRVRVKQ
jgi:hypothetical protein